MKCRKVAAKLCESNWYQSSTSWESLWFHREDALFANVNEAGDRNCSHCLILPESKPVLDFKIFYRLISGMNQFALITSFVAVQLFSVLDATFHSSTVLADVLCRRDLDRIQCFQNM